VARNFKPLLRHAGATSERLIDCGAGISRRTHTIGAFNFALDPGTAWHFHTRKKPPRRWPKYIDEEYVPWIGDAFKANNEIKVGALIQINVGCRNLFETRQ
jgi:hypothetical protein